MSTKALISKKLGAAMMAFLAAVVAFTLTVPATAYAASLEAGSVKTAQATNAPTKSVCAKKAKTLKKQGFSTDPQTIDKKALKVKRGTTKLKVKTEGFIKFTASKSKKYSFKFSGLSGAYCAHTTAYTRTSGTSPYCSMKKLSTKGGKDSTLRIAKKGYNTSSPQVVNRYLSTRTGSVKMTQGETIYFYIYIPAKKGGMTVKVS